MLTKHSLHHHSPFQLMEAFSGTSFPKGFMFSICLGYQGASVVHGLGSLYVDTVSVWAQCHQAKATAPPSALVREAGSGTWPCDSSTRCCKPISFPTCDSSPSRPVLGKYPTYEISGFKNHIFDGCCTQSSWFVFFPQQTNGLNRPGTDSASHVHACKAK